MTSISGVSHHLPHASFQRPTHGADKGGSVGRDSKSGQGNPAQSAQAALANRTDLANKPFGSIVSLFARGLPLPSMETASDVTSPAVDTTNSDTASDTGAPTNTSSA